MSNSVDNLGAGFEHLTASAHLDAPVPSQSRRAFITAPSSVDTTVVRSTLKRRGITPYELDELTTIGRSIPELVEDSVRNAELVVAILGDGAPNVLIDVGYAMAFKKRILVLVPPGEMLPFSLTTSPHLFANADNVEAIEFGLDRILSLPSNWMPPTHEQSRITRPIGDLADQLLSKLTPAIAAADEKAVLGIVREAFLESLVIVYDSFTPKAGRREYGDMAVWSDDFEPWLGNPLVVEVKLSLATDAAKAESARQFSDYLARVGKAWGLLLYGESDSDQGETSVQFPRVVVISIQRFLETLREKDVGTWLNKLRNARVHGRI